MPKIDIKNRVQVTLKRMPKKHSEQVSKAMLALMADPLPQDSHMLTDARPLRRQSVGEYRIIYWFDSAQDTVRVPLIGKRNDEEIYGEVRRLMQNHPVTLSRLERLLR